MSDPPGQGPYRLHFLGMAKLPFQRMIFGDVAADHHHRGHFVTAVMDRGGDKLVNPLFPRHGHHFDLPYRRRSLAAAHTFGHRAGATGFSAAAKNRVAILADRLRVQLFDSFTHPDRPTFGVEEAKNAGESIENGLFFRLAGIQGGLERFEFGTIGYRNQNTAFSAGTISDYIFFVDHRPHRTLLGLQRATM